MTDKKTECVVFDIEDLRAHKRQKQKLSVVISFPKTDATISAVEVSCRTEDISATGLKIISPQALSVKSELSVAIKVNEFELSFKFKAEVKWCDQNTHTKQFLIGVKLTQILENQYENWLATVKILNQ